MVFCPVVASGSFHIDMALIPDALSIDYNSPARCTIHLGASFIVSMRSVIFSSCVLSGAGDSASGLLDCASVFLADGTISALSGATDSISGASYSHSVLGFGPRDFPSRSPSFVSPARTTTALTPVNVVEKLSNHLAIGIPGRISIVSPVSLGRAPFCFVEAVSASPLG